MTNMIRAAKRKGLFVDPDGLAMLEPAASRVRQLGWERLSLDLSCLLSLLSSSYCPTSLLAHSFFSVTGPIVLLAHQYYQPNSFTSLSVFLACLVCSVCTAPPGKLVCCQSTSIISLLLVHFSFKTYIYSNRL